LQTLNFTYCINDIHTIASEIVKHFDSKIILFNGEMGAGKTTLIKALLKAMGSGDIATSPTFSIVNEYKLPNDKVYHFDFYRIESIEEAYNFGIEEYLNSDNWLFMEWANRIEALLPENFQTLSITDLGNNKRALKLTINTNKPTDYKTMTVSKF